MTNTTTTTENTQPKKKVVYRGGSSEAVYGLGMIGAWIYYFSHASTFVIGLLGFFKGIVWPAILVFEVLRQMHG